MFGKPCACYIPRFVPSTSIVTGFENTTLELYHKVLEC